MVAMLETVYVYLNKSHQGKVQCVHCRTKTSLTMAHHKAQLGSKALQVHCPACRKFFCVIFEYRRHHRTQSALPGKLFLYNVPDELDTITVTSLSASGIGFTTTQHIPTPGERYDVVFFLDDKHRTVLMEEIIIRWVAGTAVGAEFYAHATAQQTLAVVKLPNAAQAHWVSDNAVVWDETRGPNPNNGAMQTTTSS